VSTLSDRLSPHGSLGLQLAAGALALTGFAWLFGGIAEDVVNGDPLTLLDVQLAQWFNAHATPAFTRAMVLVSDLNDVLAVSVMAAFTAIVLAWRRAWSWLVVLVLAVPGGMLINVLMKFAFHRARPTFDHPLLVLTSYSFPSGHVAGATLFYGFLAALLASRCARWRHRMLLVLAASVLIALVALSRMYLGAHYLSDVLAAFAEGAAWLTWCLMVSRSWARDQSWKASQRMAPSPSSRARPGRRAS
jgi:membrane-associated phospholipid phosphatase